MSSLRRVLRGDLEHAEGPQWAERHAAPQLGKRPFVLAVASFTTPMTELRDRAAVYLSVTGSGPPPLSQFASVGESNSDNRSS